MIKRAPTPTQTPAVPPPALSTREQWLETAFKRLRPSLLAVSLTCPESIYVSVGFPSVGALREKDRRIGECWRSSVAENIPHIFISPLIADDVRALDVLLHEMIHASGIAGHRANFAKPAKALGLEGKPTHTTAGEELTKRLNELIAEIGPYPHKALSHNPDRKKQSTRLIKSECDECGAIIRVTRKLIDDPGLPICACGGRFGVD